LLAETLKQKEKAERAQIAAKLRSAKEKARKAVSCAVQIKPTRPSLEEEGEEVDTDLPPSTAPPRLEGSGGMKRTRRRTLDFVLLHTGTASKKGKA
jgi:hypothetical protein